MCVWRRLQIRKKYWISVLVPKSAWYGAQRVINNWLHDFNSLIFIFQPNNVMLQSYATLKSGYKVVQSLLFFFFIFNDGHSSAAALALVELRNTCIQATNQKFDVAFIITSVIRISTIIQTSAFPDRHCVHVQNQHVPHIKPASKQTIWTSISQYSCKRTLVHVNVHIKI